MTEWFEAGRAAWPEVDLAPDTFDRYVTERSISMDSPHGSDLYLACACVHGAPGALEAFEGAMMSRMPAFLRSLRPTPVYIDEVSQLVRERLFVGASPKIAEYMGKGPLAGWLRVVAVRMAIDLRRTRGEQPQETLDPERHIVGSRTSPELLALRNQHRPMLKEALATAFAALSSDDRNLLRLHYMDGMSLAAIGRLFKLNRSTVLRRLQACTDSLLLSVRGQLGTRLGISSTEADSLAGALKVDPELSIGALLRSEH